VVKADRLSFRRAAVESHSTLNDHASDKVITGAKSGRARYLSEDAVSVEMLITWIPMSSGAKCL
jgi:hypothetical protein